MDMSNEVVADEQRAIGIAGKVNWQLEDMSYFRKCGEITASPDVECFGLNCRFCSGICLQFEVFMQHLREQHSKDILAMYTTTTSPPTCEKQTQTNAFIDMQGEMNENETVIGVEQLHTPTTAIDKLTQISYSNENSAELKILSSNLDNLNGTFTIQLELLPENNNNKMLADNEQVSLEEPMECALADRAQLAELMAVSCTPTALSSMQTFCIVEHTLPDILLSVDDALEPSKSTATSGCEPNNSNETTKSLPTQIPASTNGNNGITLASAPSEVQQKHTKIKRKHKQCNEVIFLIFMTK